MIRMDYWRYFRVPNHIYQVPTSEGIIIPLPKFLQYSLYKLINIQNTEQECFKWCIARSDCLNRGHNERVSREVKEHAEKYDWTGIKFPISIRQIDRFQKQNNVSDNLYVNEGVSFYPLKITEVIKEKRVDLLLLDDEQNKHFVLIEDLNRLINPNTHKKAHTCHWCLPRFYQESLRIEHEENCSKN